MDHEQRGRYKTYNKLPRKRSESTVFSVRNYGPRGSKVYRLTSDIEELSSMFYKDPKYDKSNHGTEGNF